MIESCVKEIASLTLVAVKKEITPLKVATPHQSTFVDSFSSRGSLEEILSRFANAPE